jgi:O-antigen/teichoic acid export membrane protein
MAPLASRAYVEGGAAAVRHVVLRATMILGAVMASFSLVMIVFGGRLAGLLFGSGFAVHGDIIALLSLGVLATALGIPSGDGLRVTERADVNFKAALIGLSVTLTLTASLVFRFGVLGAATGLLAGCSVSSAAKCAAFFTLTAVDRRAPLRQHDLTPAAVGRAKP